MTEVRGVGGELLQEENPLGIQQDPTWTFNPNVQFGENINDNAFDWSHFFTATANHSTGFLDTRHGEAFMEGFKDENFVAMAIDAYLNPPPHFVRDIAYNPVDDTDMVHRELYLQDKDYFSQAVSHAHFEHLIEKRKEQMALMETGGAYMTGRVFGGAVDVSNVFLTSRLATPIYQSGRIKRTVGTTKILGAEEIGKQLIDEDRTWQEGATIIGANAIISMLLPKFKGFTADEIEAIKNHIRHNDLIDDAKGTLVAPNIEIVEGSTMKYRNNNPKSHLYGKTLILKEGEKPPVSAGWEEVGARVNTKDGVTTIYINRKKIAQDFKNKVWTKPKVKGVFPLKEDTFKSVEEYTDFVIRHEKAHTYIKQKKGETKGEYENRINEIALKLVKGKTSVPKTDYTYNQRKEYQQDHAKYLEELENEKFKETILGSWGESSIMTPITRIVNSGELDAIKYGNAILGMSFLTKGNFKNRSSVQSLEKWLLADNKVYGNTIMEVEKIYKKYKQNSADPVISFKEFKQRVSLSLINSEYVDSIPAVMTAKKSVRDYYDYVGKKIKDSEIRINEQEILIGSLQSKLNQTKGNTVTITAKNRDGTTSVKKYTKKEFKEIIDEEINLLEKWKKNPLRKDYLNRFVNKGKINDNVEAYRAFAKASLTRTNPTFPPEVIDDLVRQYEESFPWKQYGKMDLDKAADDVIIEKYFFSPSTYSKNLKRRGNFVLDHEEWMKAGYMESDAFILMHVYHKSVLPDTYLASIFGTADTMGGAFLAKKGYQAGLTEVAENYKVKINEAKTSDEKAKIIEQRNKVLKDMEAIRDLFKGVYGVPPDPTQFWSRGVRLMKHFNAWTSLTGAMASVVDLARSVFFNGMTRSLGATWESFNKGLTKKIYDISLKECRASGECLDMLLNTRALSYNDLDNVYGSMDKLERGANSISSVFFMANLMSPWNQIIKQHNTMLITTRILEECENLVNGKITKLNKAKLAQAGINEEDAHAIMQQYINHGQGKGSYKGVNARNDENLKYIRLAKSYEWFNEDIAKKFQLAVQNDLRLSIVTPSLADTPLWMSTEVGGLIAQFKKFAMGMTNRVLIRGLQEKDANFYGGVVMMIALGMMIDRLRAKAFDSDYDNLSEAEKFKRGFERSGVGGIFTDIYTGIERLIYGDMGQKMGAAIGPTGSQLDKIQHILFTDDPSERASNVRRIWPYNNISYADGIFDQLEESIK